MSRPDLPLLNVFEVDDGGTVRQVLGFLDPVLAGSVGIGPHSVVGEYVAGPDGNFDADAFRPNPPFLEAFTQYMNEHAAAEPEVAASAREQPSGWLYMLDPRHQDDEPGLDPPASEVLGAFAVDDTGQIVPGSFQYNANHRLFDPASGVSGLFADRKFYHWLHNLPDPPGKA